MQGGGSTQARISYMPRFNLQLEISLRLEATRPRCLQGEEAGNEMLPLGPSGHLAKRALGFNWVVVERRILESQMVEF